MEMKIETINEMERTSFIIVENKKELEKTVQAHAGFLQNAKDMAAAIIDTESFQSAGKFLVYLKTLLKNWNDSRQSAIDQAHTLHKTLIADRDNIGKPLSDAIKVLGPAMNQYEQEARNKARIEREKAEREAFKAEEERRLAMAEELEKSGKNEAADSLLEEPVIAPPVLIEDTPKVEGLSFQDYWSFEVEDLGKLIMAVGAGKVSSIALLPNDKWLGQQARSMKEHFDIPGVRLIHSRRSRSQGGF